MPIAIYVQIIDSAAIMGKEVSGFYHSTFRVCGAQIRFEPVNQMQ